MNRPGGGESSLMALEYTPRAFTVPEFRRLAQLGILRSDERVELLDGIIVEMHPTGAHLWRAHDRIVRYLEAAVGARVLVAEQSSLPLGERNEPRPDVTLMHRAESTSAGEPRPEAIVAIVELANASSRIELGPKLRLYARSKIADYLVVDLEANALLHHAKPHEADYQHVARLSYGETFSLTRLADVALRVDPFLEPRGAPTE
jgi:Uma2 family endonuclease